MIKHFCDICNREIKSDNPSCSISIKNNINIRYGILPVFEASEICGSCTQEIRQKKNRYTSICKLNKFVTFL